jgi:hypothetical protein
MDLWSRAARLERRRRSLSVVGGRVVSSAVLGAFSCKDVVIPSWKLASSSSLSVALLCAAAAPAANRCDARAWFGTLSGSEWCPAACSVHCHIACVPPPSALTPK